jgi:hypothetical protein
MIYAKNVLMRASLFFSVHGLVTNPVLPLPSQRPSNGLFSPMEVRTNHLPMCTDPLVPVRRAWSCTSKATPSRGSSVQTSWQCKSHLIIKFIKCMHNTPNKSSKSSKTLHRPTIQSQGNQKATYWVNTHKKWKVSAKGYSNHV